MASAHIVACLLFVAAIAAADQPSGCCLPEQMEGKVGAAISGYAETAKEGFQTGDDIKISWDFKNKQVYSKEQVYGINEGVKETIYKFAQGVRYIIQNGVCKKEMEDREMKRCLSGDNYVATNTIGMKPYPTFIQDVYGYGNVKVKPDTTYSGYFTVAQDGCVPTSIAVSGTNGNEAGKRIFFSVGAGATQLASGINDPSVFIPPPSCDDVIFTEASEPAQVENFLAALL